jgi:hypothetical protein
VRIFKNRPFVRFARKAALGDEALKKAVSDAEKGLIDADLGGGVIEQRIARAGGGKSGGFGAIVLFRSGERAFFVHGFAKSEQDNIGDDELAAFKMLATEMLGYDDAAIAAALSAGALSEVSGDD